MPANLKQTWGVDSPKGASPDQQTQRFKAAFDPVMKAASDCLQYTAENTEKAKHDPLASKRDQTYQDYQNTLAQIGPGDPKKAEPAIQATLGKVNGLKQETQKQKSETEAALKAWKAVKSSYDTTDSSIEELETWEDKDAADLRAKYGKITEHEGQRRWTEAKADLDALLTELKPIYEEYQRQKAAKEKYDPEREAFDTAFETSSNLPEPSDPMTEMTKKITAAMGPIDKLVTDKDFVSAREKLGEAGKTLTELETAGADPARQKYLDTYPGLEDRLASVFIELTGVEKLDDMPTTASGHMTTAETAAKAGDYAGANKALDDATKTLDDYDKAKEELEKAKERYEAALKVIDEKLTRAAYGDAFTDDLKSQQTDIKNREKKMRDAADKKDFDPAAEEAEALDPIIDAYDEKQKTICDDKLKAVEPEFEKLLLTKEYKSNTALSDKKHELQNEMTIARAYLAEKQYPSGHGSLVKLEAEIPQYLKDHEVEKKKQDSTEIEVPIPAWTQDMACTVPLRGGLEFTAKITFELSGKVVFKKGQVDEAGTKDTVLPAGITKDSVKVSFKRDWIDKAGIVEEGGSLQSVGVEVAAEFGKNTKIGLAVSGSTGKLEFAIGLNLLNVDLSKSPPSCAGSAEVNVTSPMFAQSVTIPIQEEVEMVGCAKFTAGVALSVPYGKIAAQYAAEKVVTEVVLDAAFISAAFILGGVLTIGAAVLTVLSMPNIDAIHTERDRLVDLGVKGYVDGVMGRGSTDGNQFYQRNHAAGQAVYHQLVAQMEKQVAKLESDGFQCIGYSSSSEVEAKTREQIAPQESSYQSGAQGRIKAAATRDVWNLFKQQYPMHKGKSPGQSAAASLFGDFNSWPSDVKKWCGYK